jgi:hypothetical protein
MNTPPFDLAAPPVATFLLATFVVLPPFGRLDVSMLVDVGRAPYTSVAPRLSAARSNTRVPPLIRPYPPLHHTLLKIHAPPPKWDGVLAIYSLKKTHRTARAGDLGAGSTHKSFIFKKPSVHGFSRQLRIARIAQPSLLAPYRAYGTATGFPTPSTET